MTPGEKTIAAARRDLGCRESGRANGGPCVNRIQSSTGAYNLAWCASAVIYWWERADIDVAALRTAGTWDLVERAKREGRLRPEPVPGCAVVWNPGAHGHVEIFIRWINRSRGQALTIGGNTGDAVREHIRDVRIGRDYFVVPDELEAPKPVFRDVFWWEDPAAEPVRHGLYAATASREKAVRAWVDKHGSPGHVRRGKLSIRDAKGRLVPRYTFWTGQRKRSPDFTSKAKRDANLRKVAAQRPGHILRPRSKRERVS